MRPHAFDQKLLGREYGCVQFATRTNPAFTEWYSLFYRNGRKVVPKEIVLWLSPEAMAVWYMDDGSADHWGATIQTHSFTEMDVALLVGALKDRYAINCTTQVNKGKKIIYIGAADIGPFGSLIASFLLDDFKYKLIPRRFRTP